jgi:hypothetical protein
MGTVRADEQRCVRVGIVLAALGAGWESRGAQEMSFIQWSFKKMSY